MGSVPESDFRGDALRPLFSFLSLSIRSAAIPIGTTSGLCEHLSFDR